MKVDEMKKLAERIDKGKERTFRLTDKFKFRCIECGKCCFNNDVLVNVYDLIRVRNALRLPTQEIFKKEYVNFYLGPSSGLPVLAINFLKFGQDVRKCPFVFPAINFEVAVKYLERKKEGYNRENLVKELKENPTKLAERLEGIKIENLALQEWLKKGQVVLHG